MENLIQKPYLLTAKAYAEIPVFLSEVMQTRTDFVQRLWKHPATLEQMTLINSLLIMYDQMTEALKKLNDESTF